MLYIFKDFESRLIFNVGYSVDCKYSILILTTYWL